MRAIVHRDRYIYQWSQEFLLLDEYLKYIEENIDLIIKKIITNLEEDAPDFGLVHPDSAEMIFSRFLLNNYLLSLWATFEMGLKETARFLSKAKDLNDFETYKHNKQKQKQKPKPKPKREDRDFVTQIFKYFKEIHKMDIPTVKPIDKEYLVSLYQLRNIIAHGNGRIKDISGKEFQELEIWIKKQSDITVSARGWILLNRKFCRETFNSLSISFSKLCKLVYEDTPGIEPRPTVGGIWQY